MNFLDVKVEALKVGDWSKKFLEVSHVSRVVDQSCRLYGPDGKLQAVLLRDGVSMENMRRAWKHLRDYWPVTNNRGTSSGSGRKYRLKKDGTVSNTSFTESANSGVIGFYDRYPRIPFCRKCSYNQKEPDAFREMLPLFREVSKRFGEVWPEKFRGQAAVVEQTHPDFVIPGTIFTTVTVNKNYRTAAHLDPKNLEGSISTMLVMHEGRVEGGELVLPEYDVA